MKKNNKIRERKVSTMDLLDKRIIYICGEINDFTAKETIDKLLKLDAFNQKDITMYINSPGGSVSSGFAIYDVMNIIKSDISTICVGKCASMASILLINGAKGKRYILPNAEVMIHQPLGGVQGQATEIKIAAERILKLKEKLNTILAKNTGKDIKTITKDTERDYFLDSQEAVEYGIIDKILEKRN